MTPASVSRAVHAARRAIGDDGDRQSTIRTLRGRGFRFVAQVDEVSGADPLPAHVPYVGRDALLAELYRKLETVAARGGPRVLLLSGDAGIGKTRTAREIASWAESVGFEVRDEQVHETDAPFASFDRLASSKTPVQSVVAPRADLIAHLDAFRRFLETADRELAEQRLGIPGLAECRSDPRRRRRVPAPTLIRRVVGLAVRDRGRGRAGGARSLDATPKNRSNSLPSAETVP